MTVRVRVRHRLATWECAANGEGATLAHAVRNAVGPRGLNLGPGRTVFRARLDSHEWEWDWSGHMLVVRESRSGPSGASGASTRAKALLSLAQDDLDALDRLAEARGETRSACVARLVREAIG